MAIVFLDSGIIGLVTNPRKQGQALACEQKPLFVGALFLLSLHFQDYCKCPQ
jgi:hypothetical protein